MTSDYIIWPISNINDMIGLLMSRFGWWLSHPWRWWRHSLPRLWGWLALPGRGGCVAFPRLRRGLCGCTPRFRWRLPRSGLWRGLPFTGLLWHVVWSCIHPEITECLLTVCDSKFYMLHWVNLYQTTKCTNTI